MYIQLSIAALQCDVFFAYVPTDANIADIPSRARDARSVSDLKLILNLGDTSENKLESRAMILPHVKVLTLDGMRRPIETPQRVPGLTLASVHARQEGSARRAC